MPTQEPNRKPTLDEVSESDHDSTTPEKIRVQGEVGQVIEGGFKAYGPVHIGAKSEDLGDDVQSQIAEEQAFRKETGFDYGPPQRASFRRATHRYNVSMRTLARVEKAGYAAYDEEVDAYHPKVKPAEDKIFRGMALIFVVMIMAFAWVVVTLMDAKEYVKAGLASVPMCAFVWYLADVVRSNLKPHAIAKRMAARDARVSKA